MGRDIPLGRIAGIKVSMDLSVLLVAGFYTWVFATNRFPIESPGMSTTVYWIGGVAGAFLFFVSLLVHEVGHALGLRHNFRASRVRSERELSDREFTSAHALAGSVMEYLPINLPRPGEHVVAPFQATLGEYDYWAI